ncbi:MAG: GldG family protein [Butyricicoccus porcorum]|nr:GldG family protein [Butyricicoccus porcorum]
MKRFHKKNKAPKAPVSPEQKAQKRKRLRRVSVSAAGLAFALAAVILLNLVCTNLTDRFDLTLDLTANQLYEITDDTKTMLESMEDTVDITILAAEDDFRNDSYYGKVYTLLNKYVNLAGDNITVEYIDPYTNPNVVSRYSDLAATIQAGSVIVSCGDHTRVLNDSDFYTTESSSSYSGYSTVTGFQGEQALTSAITAVTSDQTPVAYLLQGHNESVSTTFTSMLTNAGFTVSLLNLTEEKEIPDDASIVVISLPQADLTETEADLIDAFVKGGGDLMVFDGTLSPTSLPVLYSYLKEWGADVQADMVLDADYNINEEPDILAQLTDSDVNSALDSKTDMVLVTPNAKSITAKLDSSVTDRTIETLMESRDTAYAKVLTDETEYDSYAKADGDTDGPFALATLSTYTGNDDGGQVFVCSAALMMTDDLMSASSLLNRSFLSNVVSEMQPDLDVVTIAAKSLSAEPLIAGTTAQFVIFLLLALFPLALFGTGIAVFFRRRKL